MQRKRILVTGGAGYVGSHACKALSRAGYMPVTLDNLSRGHRYLVKWGPLLVGDILRREDVAAAFERFKPCAVMHFAALAYVGDSVSQPLTYYRTNFCGSLNLVEAAQQFGCRLFTFSSTCAVYGEPSRDIIDETDPKAPINPYGFSKLAVERMLDDQARASRLRFVALRYFNAAGADADGDTGEDHRPETHLIPRTLIAAQGSEPAIDVYGADYPTADGTAVRDYIHVADLAEAHVAALRYLESGGESIALNLGTARGHSVREVIETVESITGRFLTVRVRNRRPGDPAVLVASPRRAEQVLGWRAKHVALSDIVRSAWRWHSRQAHEIAADRVTP